MRKGWIPAILAALAMIAWSQPVASQQDAATDQNGDALLREVRTLNRSVEKLVSLLERAVVRDDVELLLRRIQLQEGRIAPLERRVRSAEDEVTGRETELKEMKAMLRSRQDALNDELQAGSDSALEAERMINDFRMHIKRLESSLDDRRLRLRTLEDELAAQRDEIEILDDKLMELLDER